MTITPTARAIFVWDIWVRLTHVSYPLFLLALWWTAENRLFNLHIPIAIVFSGVLTLRLAWGFLGTDTARFSQFIGGPRHVWAYARSLFSTTPQKQTIGHNPMGGLSVLALLLLMMAQISTGLFAVDTDGLNSGALSRFVSFDTGRTFGDYHELTFNILLGMVALHLVAILAYAVLKRTNLARPMVTGYMHNTEHIDGDENSRPRPLGVALSLLAALFVSGTLGWLQFL